MPSLPTTDCHANFSFVFIHPVIPHYSTLLKFDTAQLPPNCWRSRRILDRSDRQAHLLRSSCAGTSCFTMGRTLTSADVKASYDRIIHPPPGVLSVRQADYAAVTEHRCSRSGDRDLSPAMAWTRRCCANFASPWNCIYSAARLKEDALFPKTHVLGSGPFVFVEHVKGDHWVGKRWDRYFLPTKPYLDGYQSRIRRGAAAVMKEYGERQDPWPSSAASRRRSVTRW